MAGELGYLIAIPLVAFALGGRLLDKQFGTSPFLFLAGLLFSLVITSVAVYRKVAVVAREISDSAKPVAGKKTDPETPAVKKDPSL